MAEKGHFCTQMNIVKYFIMTPFHDLSSIKNGIKMLCLLPFHIAQNGPQLDVGFKNMTCTTILLS